MSRARAATPLLFLFLMAASALSAGPAPADSVDLTEAQELLVAGREAEALVVLDRALQARPDAWWIHPLRARALDRLDRPAEALAAVELALAGAARSEPAGLAELHLVRADLIEQLEGPAAAAAGLEAAIRRIGPDGRLVLRLIDLESRRGRYDAALALLDERIEAGELDVVWVARKAEVLLEAGRRGQARETFRDALARLGAWSAAQRRSEAGTALRRRLRTGLARTADPDYRPPGRPATLPER